MALTNLGRGGSGSRSRVGGGGEGDERHLVYRYVEGCGVGRRGWACYVGDRDVFEGSI